MVKERGKIKVRWLALIAFTVGILLLPLVEAETISESGTANLPLWKKGDSWGYTVKKNTETLKQSSGLIDELPGYHEIFVGYQVLGEKTKKGEVCYDLIYWIDFSDLERAFEEFYQSYPYEGGEITVNRLDYEYYGHTYYRVTDMAIIYESYVYNYNIWIEACYDGETTVAHNYIKKEVYVDYSDPIEIYQYPFAVGDEWEDVAVGHFYCSIEEESYVRDYSNEVETREIEGDIEMNSTYKALGMETLESDIGDIDTIKIDYSRDCRAYNVHEETSVEDKSTSGTRDAYSEEESYSEYASFNPMIREGEGAVHYDVEKGYPVKEEDESGTVKYEPVDTGKIGRRPSVIADHEEKKSDIISDNMFLIVGIAITTAVVMILVALIVREKRKWRAKSKMWDEPPQEPQEYYWEPDTEEQYTEVLEPDRIYVVPGVNEIQSSKSHTQPSCENSCPHCGEEIDYVEKYDRWYCHSCQRYL